MEAKPTKILDRKVIKLSKIISLRMNKYDLNTLRRCIYYLEKCNKNIKKHDNKIKKLGHNLSKNDSTGLTTKINREFPTRKSSVIKLSLYQFKHFYSKRGFTKDLITELKATSYFYQRINNITARLSKSISDGSDAINNLNGMALNINQIAHKINKNNQASKLELAKLSTFKSNIKDNIKDINKKQDRLFNEIHKLRLHLDNHMRRSFYVQNK